MIHVEGSINLSLKTTLKENQKKSEEEKVIID